MQISAPLAPTTKAQLLVRIKAITNKSIEELSHAAGLIVPTSLHHAKGWIGQLIEWHLGASAGSQSLPDFPNLGIELKTIPLTAKGLPKESTFVCTCASDATCLNWQESWVKRKLAHVLWVPILNSDNPTIGERHIGKPLLWQPTPEIESVLATDWYELTEMLALGMADNIQASLGTYLHVRPKAANHKQLIPYLNASGHTTYIMPQGFYLRSSLTKQLNFYG